MQLGLVQHIGDELFVVGDAPQLFFHHLQAQYFVAVGGDAPVLLHLRSHALAQIVKERREHEAQRVFRATAQLRRLVQGQHGVGEHVALRVEFGVLLNANGGLQLREELLQVIHRLKLAEVDRGLLRLEQRLLRLAQNPLHAQVGHVHRRAQLSRLHFDLRTQPRCELCGPEDAQRVLHEGGGADAADDPLLQILPTAAKVLHLAGEHVLNHGVDGEIPAQAGALRRQGRIHGHVEVGVPVPGAGFRAGHGDVDVAVAQAQHAEAGAPVVDLAQIGQQRAQFGRRYAVDLNVGVLAGHAHQAIAHEAAHVVGASARSRNQRGDVPGERQILFVSIHEITRSIIAHARSMRKRHAPAKITQG